MSARPRPPRWTRWLLARLARGESAEYTLGDLDEEFGERSDGPGGRRSARRWYRRQLWRSLIPLLRDARADLARARERGERISLRHGLGRDVRFAIRSFARRPGLTFIVLATLALGIGANTAVFSVVNGVLLRSLPYPEADELVLLSTLDLESGDTYNVSPPNFLDWSVENRTLDGVFAWSEEWRTLTDAPRRERLQIGEVSPGFLEVLDARPALGRGFLAHEQGPASPHVVVISHELWERQYGSDPSVVGRSLALDGETWEIVGVARPGLQMPLATEPVDVWLPYLSDWASMPRDEVYLTVIARLTDGVTVAEAQADLDVVQARIRDAHAEEVVNRGVAVRPLKSAIVSDVRPGLLVVLGSVALLLLLACANVANLLLMRTAGRATELGVRTALGAGRGHLRRQLLVESAVLAAAAGTLGVPTGMGGVKLLMAFAPEGVPRIRDVAVDPTVLGFTLLATVVTGLLFGALPALYVSRRDPVRLLSGGGRGQVGGGARHIREVLVVGEIAAAVVLVSAAALLGRSFGALLDVDPGFDGTDVVLADVQVPRDRYPDREARARFHRGLMERLAAVPGVEAVGGVWNAPMNQAVVNTDVWVEGTPRPQPGEFPPAEFRIATGGYFGAMRIPVLEGRTFDSTDAGDAPRRLVVSRALADELWPGVSPVGKRLSIGLFERDGEPAWYEVVGVVGDVLLNGLDDPGRGILYFSYSQIAQPGITVTARARGGARAGAAIRDAILEYEPLVPMPEITTMEGRVGETLSARRFYLGMLTAFAGIALVLAAVGIYGVLAYAVARRTAEIGVRVTFGASRRRILRSVLAEGMVVAGIGIAVGLVGALSLSRVLTSLVFGVSPDDPLTYGVVAAFLGLTALVACAVPALRAASVDPLTALRHE